MSQFVFGNSPPRDAGGFHFHQPLRHGGSHAITATTQDELVQKIMGFRMANGYDPGDPLKETNDYLCGLWPHFCRPDPTGGEADESPKDKTLLQRTSAWRANKYAQAQTSQELETQEIADQRAKICEGCPNNQTVTDGCVPCLAENDRYFYMIRKGKSTATKLGSCAVTGQDNETACFLKPDALKSAKQYKDQLPSFCWLLNLK